jgi:hypothetical protein
MKWRKDYGKRMAQGFDADVENGVIHENRGLDPKFPGILSIRVSAGNGGSTNG